MLLELIKRRMATRTLYIIYNADASIMGKINYGYRKLTAPKNKPACAACDITHGGLHLDETAEWKKAKEEMAKEAENVTLKQLHRDQMGGEVYIYSHPLSDGVSMPYTAWLVYMALLTRRRNNRSSSSLRPRSTGTQWS